MGRSLLIVVILLSAVYAGIVMNLQKKMFHIPEILTQHLINKQSENTSDYALRMAVQKASSMGIVVPADQIYNYQQVYTNFKIGKVYIDSIKFSYVNTLQQFRAKTYIRGVTKYITVNYPAEISFSFPQRAMVPIPECIYYECDQPQFHGANEYVNDTSPNNNDGEVWNGVSTRPKGSGADGWKCALFDGVDDYIYCPNTTSVQVDSALTLSVFAKIISTTATSTPYWIPSDPNDTAVANGIHPGQNLRYKPTAGIWYTASPTKQLHFAVTQTNNNVIQADVPYTPVGKWPFNKDVWHHFALTYKRGVLKAYVNGVLMATATGSPGLKAIKNLYGVCYGRRYITVAGTPSSDYYTMDGVLDQMGLFNRELSQAEITTIYQGILFSVDLSYLRD